MMPRRSVNRMEEHAMTNEATNGFRDLNAWQEAVELVTDVYELVEELPESEQYELSRQIRRSAVSIPSNIEEGKGAGSDGLYLRHVRIASGSAAELQTQLLLAERLELLPNGLPDSLKARLDEVAKMIRGLQKWLEAS